MYENLKKLLEKKGEGKIVIQKAYVLEWVFEVYKKEGPPYIPAEPHAFLVESKKTKEKVIPKLMDAIINALEKHPNIFDIERDIFPYFLGPCSIGDNKTGVAIGDNYFYFKVRIPERLQLFSQFLDSIKAQEEFSVISSGTVFALYTEVEDYPTFDFTKSEFDTLYRSQIEKETELKVIDLTTNYIRPNIYIVIKKPGIKFKEIKRKTQKPSEEPDIKVYEHENDIMIVTNFDPNMRAFISALLTDSIQQLTEYALLIASQTKLKESRRAMLNRFSSLYEAIKELRNSRFFQFKKRTRIVSDGRGILSDIYYDYIKYSDSVKEFEEYKESFEKGLNKSRTLSKLSSYFEEATELDVEIPESLHLGLTHFGNEFNITRNISSVLVATVLGAIVGALLTVIAGWVN